MNTGIQGEVMDKDERRITLEACNGTISPETLRLVFEKIKKLESRVFTLETKGQAE